MADLKFSCPHCATELECDGQFAGQEMQCPTCQGLLITPAAQLHSAPPPPPPVPPRPGGRAKSRTRKGSPDRSWRKNRGKSGAIKAVKICAIIVVAGVAGFFGYRFLGDMQGKLNKKQEEIAKNSDGGQLGHIAELYDVLDATDPDKDGGMFGGGEDFGDFDMGGGPAGGFTDPDAAREEMLNLPVVPPEHSLDVNAASIPNGKVNGMISGTNFVIELARVGLAGRSQVLSLREGTGVNPDREILVYFRLKPGEELSGYKVTVGSDMSGSDLPKVTKRWKTNPKFAPKKKTYSSGYALKLEFGQTSGAVIPGKIFVALPDEEESVVAGCFNADLPAMSMMFDDSDF